MPRLIGNDGAAMTGLTLPYKPFTLDDIKAITGVKSGVLEMWMKTRFQVRFGSGAEGLDWMQTFAVYAGHRYLEEGALTGWAEAVLDYVAMLSLEFMEEEISQGRTFPCPRELVEPSAQRGWGCMVPAPNSRLGKTLNLKILHAEFCHRVKSAFPGGDVKVAGRPV